MRVSASTGSQGPNGGRASVTGTQGTSRNPAPPGGGRGRTTPQAGGRGRELPSVREGREGEAERFCL